MLHDNHVLRVHYVAKLELGKGQQTQPKHDKYNYRDAKPFAHSISLLTRQEVETPDSNKTITIPSRLPERSIDAPTSTAQC
jgi:hypothetical protein